MMRDEAGSPIKPKPAICTLKPLGCDPQRIKGMSEQLLVGHYENNYDAKALAAEVKAVYDKIAEISAAKPCPTKSFSGSIASSNSTTAAPLEAALGSRASPAGHVQDRHRSHGSHERCARRQAAKHAY